MTCQVVNDGTDISSDLLQSNTFYPPTPPPSLQIILAMTLCPKNNPHNKPVPCQRHEGQGDSCQQAAGIKSSDKTDDSKKEKTACLPPRRRGRPPGTTKAAGFKTSPGRPRGTTLAAGYNASPGRPRGSKNRLPTKGMTDLQKSLVADFLTHSTATAENHYCMKQSDNIVNASLLLAQLAGGSSSEATPDEGSSHDAPIVARGAPHEPAPNQQMEVTDTKKSLVADYLPSTATAEKHYHMKQSDNIVNASLLQAQLAGGSSSEATPDEGSSHDARIVACGAAHEPAPNQQMEVHAAFDQLLQTVTLNGSVPDEFTRSEGSHTFAPSLYKRWLKAQRKMRTEHVLSHFNRRLPTEQRVDAWITKQGWKSNLPKAERIVRKWKPFGSMTEVMDSKVIRRHVTSQKWKGLLVTDIEGKGKGVIATRRFQAGEVVCDYHGRVVTAKEGREIDLNISEEETGYMFFYINEKQQKMSIDAHSASCECHPDKETFGRLINHSKSKSNLRPRLYTVDIDGQEKDVILFLAKRNMDVNEELLYNYGVERKSFRGAGLELDWL